MFLVAKWPRPTPKSKIQDHRRGKNRHREAKSRTPWIWPFRTNPKCASDGILIHAKWKDFEIYACLSLLFDSHESARRLHQKLTKQPLLKHSPNKTFLKINKSIQPLEATVNNIMANQKPDHAVASQGFLLKHLPLLGSTLGKYPPVNIAMESYLCRERVDPESCSFHTPQEYIRVSCITWLDFVHWSIESFRTW